MEKNTIVIIRKLKKITPRVVKKLLKRSLDFLTWDEWSSRTWSQEGEDKMLNRMFSEKKDGFYIDVGAHHPKRFSNTFMFYKRGWKGVNIDAMPGSMGLFEKYRPRDINIECGIGIKEDELDYYIFSETALNGFSRELSEERNESESKHYVKEIVKVKILPLSKILNTHIKDDQTIDFMTVDVEGLDFQVLKSNDWFKFRPKYVLVEMLVTDIKMIESSELGQYMKSVGYSSFSKCFNTVFFKNVREH